MTKPDEEILVQQLKAHLEEKKAMDIILLDLRGRTSFADFFVVASGTSQTHVATLATETDRFFHERSIRVLGMAGLPEADWVVVDGGDIVVHLFQPEMRAFYDLEKLWYQPVTKPEKPVKPPKEDKPDKVRKTVKPPKPPKPAKSVKASKSAKVKRP
ncbi:MAG: ribosome silencing factor [Magnetococcus sp. MYC-9]